ncbi:MAG TPA: DUF2332 domain-containing protein [Bryobacteraceae bacterium]|nr:DUF2332 domain-containing protein [Bryobacteraceae bacterium]
MNADEFAASCRYQAEWCQKLGSPLYQAILLKLADDVTGGRSWAAIEPYARDERRTLLPLRLLAGVHRMVLTGELPELARYYPSAGGTANNRAAEVFLDTIATRAIAIPTAVQTNEISRCCALLPGFLEIARRTTLPMRLMEIGCSAGLNLRWDRYHYATANGGWGEADSPVQFPDVYSGKAPAIATHVSIAGRNGCDLNPIDATTTNGRLDLLSFIWADQVERFAALDRAIEIARRVPAAIDRANAMEWLESKLAAPARGVVTVVFHSIVMMYLTPEQRARVEKIVRDAGSCASDDAPLAWLQMEAGGEETQVTLAFWPGGERIHIADAGFHGRTVSLK